MFVLHLHVADRTQPRYVSPTIGEDFRDESGADLTTTNDENDDGDVDDYANNDDNPSSLRFTSCRAG